MARRLPMPKSSFSSESMKRLYGRYHALANKARAKEISFNWYNFTEFYEDLISVAPEDYHPDTFRMRFELDLGKGYCKESMKVTPVGVSSKQHHNQAVAAQGAGLADFVTELAVLFLTEEGSVQDLINQAHNATA